MGGPQEAFPTTVWSDLLAAGDPASPQNRQKLEALLRTYWRPVYAYIRTAWRKSIEEAKDLTQAFFTHVLEKDYLSQMRPERGSFRGYLKQALRHFLIDAERYASARRPQGELFRLGVTERDWEDEDQKEAEESPERAFDRTWFTSLLNSSLAELKSLLHREGKEIYYRVFEAYCTPPEGPTVLRENAPSNPTYREVASRLGIQETDVRNYLTHSRRVLRETLLRRIQTYAVSPEEAERELAEAAAQ